MMVSIIIPVYNALRFAQDCVESIYQAGSSLEFEVIVVDNGSAPEVGRWLAQEQTRRAKFRYLRYEEALGYARAVNRGVEASQGEMLILLNSDTLLSPGWMEGLWEALRDDPGLGIVSPTTNHAGETMQMDFRTIGLASGKAFALFASKPGPKEVLLVPQVVTFFCAAIWRRVWTELNGLDEAYAVGNYEDDDFCLRLRMAGYRLGVLRSAFVYHHNNATFHANGIDHSSSMSRNAAVFATKAGAAALSVETSAPERSKGGGEDISVLILPRSGYAMEDTLQSLRNQTLSGFEVLTPDAGRPPSRQWVAYLRQGDVLYPFHLEALREALLRQGGDAIFSKAWASETGTVWKAAARQAWQGGVALGCMADARLEGNWANSAAVLEWPRMTWELRGDRIDFAPPPERKEFLPVALARTAYRRLLPYETRLALDAGSRKLLGLPARAQEGAAVEQPALEKLQAELEGRLAALEVAAPLAQAPVFFFNIISWGAATQRPHHFAKGLAERGHRVFWIDVEFRSPLHWLRERPLDEIAPGLRMIRLPGLERDVYHAHWSEATVDAALAALLWSARRYGVEEAVCVVNYPRWRPLLEKLCIRTGWKIIYDCLDDQKAFAELYQTAYSSNEDWLLAESDRVFSSSRVLQQRFEEHACVLLPNGADVELFAHPEPGALLGRLARPVVGFFGALADWLDMDLIQAAALRFPSWSFVYIGPPVFSTEEGEKKWRRVTDLANIHVFSQMDPRTLASSLAEFDICTMPFLDIPVTRTMNAVKLYEYLAAGKPVVSKDLPEVRYLDGGANLMRLYTTPEEFFLALQAAAEEQDPGEVARRREFASKNDWSGRVEVLSQAIEEVYKIRSSKPSSSGAQT
jgi:GT2 family glycosyltransferase/glycosyltransferase involved in cell wall biosynthesis